MGPRRDDGRGSKPRRRLGWCRPGTGRQITGVVMLCWGLAAVPTVWSAAFTVNSLTDAVDTHPGDGLCETAPGNRLCTLRAAVQETNALPGADIIEIPAGTYALITAPPDLREGEDQAASGDLDITDDLTVRGAGAAQTILTMLPANDGTDRVLHLHGFHRITIHGMTIRHGARCIACPAANGGGGIRNEAATLLLASSEVVQNGSADGGLGGGLFNDQGTVTIRDSRILENRAEAGGGGILNRTGTVLLIHSTIAGNVAEEDLGGGIANDQGTVLILKSTIARNFGDDAGGVQNAQGLILGLNSTIATNHGLCVGGVVNGTGAVVLANTTVADNQGDVCAGGIANFSGQVSLHQSILARNQSQESSTPNCEGVITSRGFNLVSDITGCTLVPRPGDRIQDPLLGDYTDSGEPGQGHVPLRPGSPAIDQGFPPTCPPTDQLGKPRRDGDGDGRIRCDIGAVEFQP
jgi:CSLREA domain-containing protein